MAKQFAKRSIGQLVRHIFPKLAHRQHKISVHDDYEVCLVTTWSNRCGIAAYSAFLANELKRSVSLRLINVANGRPLSPHFFILGFEASRSNRIVHVQFSYGMFPGLWETHRFGFGDFGALAFYLGLALGRSPVITTIHEVKDKKYSPGKIRLLYEILLDKFICLVSDVIIVHNIESRNLLIKNYGVSKARIQIFPMPCVTNPHFMDRRKAKAKLNLMGKTVITIPGFVSPNHGQDLAVSILPKLDPNAILIIAGGTRTEANKSFYVNLKAKAEELHVSDRIVFIDDFPISPTILNASDLGILPYRFGTDSLSLRLLISYHVPTVTSDLPFFRHVQEKYGCIKLFKSSDLQDLLNKTRAALASEREQEILRRGCEDMRSENTWRQIARKHVQAYLELLGGHQDALYDNKKQKERIDWLRNNRMGRTLEIGCAGGFVTGYTNADVGLDLNPWRIKFAKTMHADKDFMLASALQLPFQDKAFETILIPEIMEHVQLSQAKTILAESKRVAKSLLITLPNADKVEYDKTIVENPEHQWYPTYHIVSEILPGCRITYTSEEDFMLISCRSGPNRL